MIYINYDHFEPSRDWLEKAKKAMQELLTIQDSEKRKKYIDRKSNLWKDLKQRLFELSHGKCWYCEAKEDRSDYNVDHFRPKNRVRYEDGTEDDGYWWLAFDWRNFRLACDLCNSLHSGPDGKSHGKSDFFPLWDENRRAKGPQENLRDEMPLLLDPTVPGDSELLWFMEDGRPYPTAEENTYPFKRANTTIKILNLEDVRIVEARQALWVHCQRLIERGDRAYAQYCRGSQAGTQEYEQVCREIRELIVPTARYSATARAYFRSSTLKWVRNLV